jgi:hypothetical protein
VIIRDIYETINFNILTNKEYLNILPSIILLEKIFTFNSMISNSLNNSIHRLLFAEKFCLNEIFDEKFENSSSDNFMNFDNDLNKDITMNKYKNIFDIFKDKSTNKDEDGEDALVSKFSLSNDEKIFFAKKNKMLLINHIKYTMLNNCNLAIGNFENRNIIFSNLENMLSKFIYLKDILVNNCDLNELLFFTSNIILHYNLSLIEMEKLSKTNKFNKEKIEHFENLFQEFLTSYLNYLIMISQQISKSVKLINLNLLKNFVNSIILLKKSGTENQRFSILRNENLEINNFLNVFVKEFLINMILSNQSRLFEFLKNNNAYLNLMEISQLFNIENFDYNISHKELNMNLIGTVTIKSNQNLDLLKYSAENYKENNITNL